MVSFEVQLDENTWTEVLDGGVYIAFDLVSVVPIELYFTETADDPGDVKGVKLYTQPNISWDYEGVAFNRGVQRVWARGVNTIRGVRQVGTV